jgi:DNA (cytosine-5)-methyltransferase 1
MGFPDDFMFYGSKIEIARQIGNAVPPQLAAAIAAVVKEALDKSAIRISKTRKISKKTKLLLEDVGQSR